ncbi:UNVERIFIED_CONTAM: protein disulfide isomerase-like 1-6 [Sesamum radiatum]|uniref:Protein disulfide isomerase-like 1-6 n=1 Tax=Sesamum radiatum TaxID=300843 RepID=A0AAW2PG76_SESRA
MYGSKFTSRSLLFPLILFLLLSSFNFASVLSENEDADDLEDIDELIAIDDEQESGGNSQPTTQYENKDFGKKSEAEVLSKAQRIVLELNIDNTKRVIEGNEYVLVLGYAPWCGRSAELMPRFAEAANVLKGLGSGIVMAKLDAERYPKDASSLGIKGYPTLLLFVNGSSQPYTGGFSSEEMVIWARKKTGSPVIRIKAVAEAEEFRKQHAMYAIGLFDNFEGPDYEEFIKAAAADNEIQFVETSSTEVYVYAEANDLKKFLEPLREIAKKFKSEILFVAVDIEEDNLAKPFLTLFGLEESAETSVIAFDYNSNSKYLLESDPTSRNIEDFCTGLLQGTLSPYYKSQPIPENKNASVLTVVGKTFDDVVLRSPANIVLEVHTPWCITCETTSKQVEKLAKHFKGLDNLVFARIDASTNEHPKLQVEDYPTLLFYPANDKSNPITLPTKSGLKELAALINKNLKTQDASAKDEL